LLTACTVHGQLLAKGLGGPVPYSILIVDDNPVLRRCLRRLVEQNEAWSVCGEAENGQIAVEKVSQLTPDLVILDWQMPVMGGLDAARQIRLASPNTIIVMFTMHSGGQVEKDAHDAGIAHVLSKVDGGADHLLAILTSLSGARQDLPLKSIRREGSRQRRVSAR
jgi:DNA-binding NarL/FixJ family response regulator